MSFNVHRLLRFYLMNVVISRILLDVKTRKSRNRVRDEKHEDKEQFLYTQGVGSAHWGILFQGIGVRTTASAFT